MASPENRNARRVGILAAASLAGALGTGMAVSSSIDFRKQQDEYRVIISNNQATGVEDPRTKQIIQDMTKSLAATSIGGLLLAGGAVTIGVNISNNQSGRRRPAFLNTVLVEPQQKG